MGDWLLQSDWMAQGKKKGLFTLAGLVHFATYTAIIIGALWLSGAADNYPPLHLVLSAVIILVSHWLLDATDFVERWKRFYGQSGPRFVSVMIDQTFHFLVLAFLTVFLFGG